MTYDHRQYVIRNYFGYDQRTINAWSKKGVKFGLLYDKYHKVKRYGGLKSEFYKMFRTAKAEEFYIDRLWERFMHHVYKVEVRQEEVKKYNKELVKIANEVKQGRKI